jgi:hypothetical protein
VEIDNSQLFRNLFGSFHCYRQPRRDSSLDLLRKFSGLESDNGAQLNVNDSTISNNGVGLPTDCVRVSKFGYRVQHNRSFWCCYFLGEQPFFGKWYRRNGACAGRCRVR